MAKGGVRPNSGRKSSYEEMKRAVDTHSMFFGAQEQEEIEKRIRSGKFSVFDRYLLTAMEGDTKILESLSKKVLPDKIDVKGDITISELLDELDGQEITQQTVADQPPLQDQKQEGEVDHVQTEPSAS